MGRGGEGNTTENSLLRMDNFPGSLQWPPSDEPGVLGQGTSHVLPLPPLTSHGALAIIWWP